MLDPRVPDAVRVPDRVGGGELGATAVPPPVPWTRQNANYSYGYWNDFFDRSSPNSDGHETSFGISAKSSLSSRGSRSN